MSYPLDGVKVLDLTRVFAGPLAGRMLVDLGADVVKIEPPEGDVSRNFGIKPQSAYFCQQNAGKRSVTVDFNDPAGIEQVLALADVADIVLENFRPGILTRFGLDWEALSARNPKLVMLSISGFGQDGPERTRAAYAGVVHAETGVVARRVSGEHSGGDIEISMADAVSGLHGVIGVLAALRHAEATGEGQHIDIAMMDAMLTCDDMLSAELAGTAPAKELVVGTPKRSNADNSEIFDAPGGPIMVIGDKKWIWYSIHHRLGIEDPAGPDTPIKEKVALRMQAWQDLMASFTDRAEMTATLDKANLAWGNVSSGHSIGEQPTVQHRGTLVDLTDSAGAAQRVVRAPYRFSGLESGVRNPAPIQGEHAEAVQRDWLGAAD